MGKYYCRTHDREYNNNCPGCQADQAEEDRQSIIEGLSDLSEEREEQTERIVQAIKDAEYKRANPGDYRCPYCLLVTLNEGASCCPMCQRTITATAWEEIYEKKRVADEEAALRRKARLEREEARRSEKRREERRSRQEGERSSRLAFFFGYLLPILSIVTTIGIGVVFLDKHLKGFNLSPAAIVGYAILLCPGLNWLLCLAFIFSDADGGRFLILGTITFWALVGSLVHKATYRNARDDW